ncbi:thermosome subunit beta [Ferroplasma sp.]|uniref:thermosome subunit beta n=1 Tax=Ferroplasma sp. TaxID=2591003 RepID=UPI00261A6641|nr:thermosome subunit beta [Ferroplasma sp.]
MIGGQPIFILKEGTKRESGKDAMFENIDAAKAIATSIRSTLGPRGMDKMLVDSLGDIVITNDGVTILKEMDVEHPAAKMMVEVSKTQDSYVGDGTTTAVIIAGALLDQAEGLVKQNVHPTVITEGYKTAAAQASRVLDEISKPVSIKDKEILIKMAKTSLNSKSASVHKDLLGEISYNAIKNIAEERDGKYLVDFDNLQVVKKNSGEIDQTELIDGIILDKEKVHPNMPKIVRNARIALLDLALEIKKPEFDTNLQISDPSMIQKFLGQEEDVLKEMVDKIKATGANVVITQKGIDDIAQHYLAKDGIYAVRRVKKSDMDKLAKATGATIVSSLEEIVESDLGSAAAVEERKISDDYMTFVTGSKNPKAISLLIRAGTEHVADEIERSLTDSLHVVAAAVEDGAYVTGGGSAAEEMAFNLRNYATKVGGRQQLAIEKFADALEEIPRALSENAGLDPIDILIRIRSEHANGHKTYGINVFSGNVEDMEKTGVIEPIRIGKQAVEAATEAAVMILRIDDVIATRSSKGGSPGGMGGMPPGGDY